MIINSAVKEVETSAWLEQGDVIIKNQNSFTVSTPEGIIFAQKAVSCLIEPEEGDNVLISTDAKGNTFILAILKRNKPYIKNDIILQGDVNFISKTGEIKIQGENGVNVSTNNNLNFTSNKININSHVGKVAVDKISIVSRIFYGQIKTIKMVCASVEQFIGRLTQKLQNCFKFVKEHNEVQAGSSRHLVDDMLTVQSKNALHQAEEVITINGEQVHMG